MKTQPTPWKVHGDVRIVDHDGTGVCAMSCENYRQSKYSAALVVRAVNSHKELLQIVKDLRNRSFWDFEKLDAIIAKAEGNTCDAR